MSIILCSCAGGTSGDPDDGWDVYRFKKQQIVMIVSGCDVTIKGKEETWTHHFEGMDVLKVIKDDAPLTDHEDPDLRIIPCEPIGLGDVTAEIRAYQIAPVKAFYGD